MMAKKSVKNMAKRSLAMFMTLVMTVSMLQLHVFAAGYRDQTMDGWYELSEENEVLGTTAEPSTETQGFLLSKEIEQTGENAFDITLKVVTSQTVTTDSAAVMLVIDNSSSMESCADCGRSNCWTHSETRLDAIKRILTEEGGFLDGLATGNSGNVYVSVVSFDVDAKKVTEWTDIKQPDNMEGVKAAINAVRNATGTNIEGGLMLGRNRLAMDAVANAASKYLVLLSDGAATRSANESTSVEEISGAYGSSTDRIPDVVEDIRAGGTTIYAVGYNYDDEQLEEIAGAQERTFSGTSSAEISAAFANIAQSATAGMNGGGTRVIDPMGEYIVLGDVSHLAEEKATAAGGTVTWELDPVNAVKKTSGDVTTYTYEITYPITLDTAARGFEEGVYYPANRYTYLSVPTADGEMKLPFRIPGVCGWLPEADWEIEYYLQDEAQAGDYESYTLDDSAGYGPVKLWSTVSAPEGYEAKYAEQFYTFASGQTQMQVVPEGENVMRLYYDHIMVPVTVNHYYKTDTILPTGEEIPGAYPDTPDKTEMEYVRAASAYVTEPETVFGGAEYELEQVVPGLEIVAAVDADNVIDLYYTRLDDRRVITSARVDHIYTTYAYELEDGSYVLREKACVTEIAEQATAVRATTVFNVDPAPLTGYEDFELNKALGDYDALLLSNGTLGFTVAEDPEDNVRTLYYELVQDDRQPISVTVNHNYIKNVTAVENGQAVTTVSTGSFSLTEDAYVGESYTAEEINGYEGEEYISDPGNAARLHIDALSGDAVIDLYYELVLTPELTEVTVNHYWRTYNEVTVELTEEVTDPETGEVSTVVVGTDVEIREELDHSEEDILVEGLYFGQEYTAPKRSWEEGYTFNGEESNPTVIAGEEYVIDMYYDRWTQSDERSDADIDTVHNYTTYLTTVVDGEVTTLTVPDGSVSESFGELKAGDPFTVEPMPVYNENEYIRGTGDEELSVILQPGTNATVVVDYEREISDLVQTAYQVGYEYRTYIMTVDETGKAGYWGEPETELISSDSVPGYVGQRVELDPGDREGFAPLSTNPAAVQLLAEGENLWIFVHERYIPLQPGTVTVNHYYKTTTVAIDGTSSVGESVTPGTPVSLYEGERFLTQSVPNGFELVASRVDGTDTEVLSDAVEVIVSGDTVVDYYYEKVIDNSILTGYTIAHIYNLYTWDAELISSNRPDPISGEGYVTTRISADPEPNTYELTESTYNEQPLDPPYTVTLQEGNNDIVFVYEKYLPRELLDVKVIHNYYNTESEIGLLEPVSVYEETAAEVPEDSIYTARLREIEGFRYFSADPESMEIEAVKGGENVIVINYVRQISAYRVIHEYLCNGEPEGVVDSGNIEGFVGDQIRGETIPRITAYEGNNYEFDSITEDIVLEAGTVNTITLTYRRTVYIPPPQPGIDIVKRAGAEKIEVGEAFAYTLTVTSVGNAPATNVVVTDILPAGVELVAKLETLYRYDPETRTLTWEVGELESGEGVDLSIGTEQSVSIEVIAPQAGTFRNVAAATADDDIREEDEAVVSVESPELEIVKKSSADTVKVGEKFTYTVTVKSMGTAEAANVVVTDILPEGIELADGSGQRELSWQLGTMAPGTEQSVSIEVIANRPGAIRNIAVVTADGGVEEETEETVIATAPALSITKRADVYSVYVGRQFTYTITVKSVGTAEATNVSVTDILPEGIELADGSGQRELSWQLGTMAPGTEQSVSVEVIAARTGTFRNVAAVTADDDIREEDEAVVSVESPELRIVKKANANTVKVGEKFSYIITVESVGTAKATNVVVTDILPEGIELADGSGQRELSWQLGDMPIGAGKTVAVEVIATRAGIIRNIAVVTADRGVEEESEEIITATAPALSITKSANVRSVLLGEKFTYTVTVKSVGTAEATNVEITDVLPEGIELADGSGQRELSWQLGTMAPGTEQSVSVEVIACEMGTVRNVAAVTADDDIREEDEETVVVTEPDRYPIVISKILDGNRAERYEEQPFTFTVTGEGVNETFTVTGEGEQVMALYAGTYTVTESDGYDEVYYEGTTVNGEEGREITFELTEAGMEIEFVNTYRHRRPSTPDDPDTPEDPDDPGELVDPVVPEDPTEPEIPGAEPVVDIPDGDVPMAVLPEDPIPYAAAPQTGEEGIYRLLAVLSGLTLAVLAATGRRKEDEAT